MKKPGVDFGAITDHTGYHIRRAYSYFSRVFSVYGKRYSVRSQQATILTLARQNPGISPATIADANDIERSLVARLVSELEQRGYIERRAGTTDGRNRGLFITRPGARFLDKIMTSFATEMEPRLTRNLSAAERRTLIRLLEKIYRD